jgi:hypothetical protein
MPSIDVIRGGKTALRRPFTGLQDLGWLLLHTAAEQKVQGGATNALKYSM